MKSDRVDAAYAGADYDGLEASEYHQVDYSGTCTTTVYELTGCASRLTEVSISLSHDYTLGS